MKKRWLTWAVVCFMCVLSITFSGCQTMERGNPALKDATNESVSQKIIEGKTTKEEVRTLYGSPMSTSFTDGGQEIWDYQYASEHATAASYINPYGHKSVGNNKDLKILFNKKDIVEKFTMNETKTETKVGLFPK